MARGGAKVKSLYIARIHRAPRRHCRGPQMAEKRVLMPEAKPLWSIASQGAQVVRQQTFVDGAENGLVYAVVTLQHRGPSSTFSLVSTAGGRTDVATLPSSVEAKR